MTRTSVCRLLPAVVAAVLAGAMPAAAQTNEEIFQQFQWNFATPGARASAMGQAFIGVADDATATVTNPAGLLNLTRRQVYFELKSDNYEVERFARRDSLFTGDTTTFGNRLSSLPFFDVAIPVNERLVVAFTRHEFINADEEFDLDPRPIPNHPTNNIFFGLEGRSEFKGVAYAGTVAFSPVQMIRVGATISFNQFSAETRSTRFYFSGFGSDVQNTSIIANETVIDDDSTAMGVTIGALFTPRENVNVGVVYQKSPSFEVQESFQTNPSSFFNLPLRDVAGFPATVAINVPDRFGVGVGVRPQPRLLVALDAVWVQYSALTDETLLVFDRDVLPTSAFFIDDKTEVHAGAEYMIRMGANPIFVRGGVYTNPHHGIRYTPVGNAAADAVYNALFNLEDGDTAVSGTVGAGITLGRRLQLDVAFMQGGDIVGSAAIRF